MKNTLEQLLREAIATLQSEGKIQSSIEIKISLERTKDPKHGDFASNLALTLAKSARKIPRQLAEEIINALPQAPIIQKTEIAGPGFINFFLNSHAQYEIIKQIHDQNAEFGKSTTGNKKRIQIEFVSANPTGPLHVGHGRGAAYGSAVASLLDAIGFDIHQEYYVNDAGRQMDILATTIWLRYLEECGEILAFPSNAYRGEYVREIAAQIHLKYGDEFRSLSARVFENIPADEPDGGDKEIHIDALIKRAQTLLGPKRYEIILKAGLDSILADIRDDLEDFGVEFDEWYSERKLMHSDAVHNALQVLDSAGHLYQKDGATWFACSQLGDEKDRVVIRDNGQTTYLASDIAYHLNKLERGFERIIDVWGADHHGYIARVRAAINALGQDATKLDVLLVQFAVLYRGSEKVPMSTRSGEFVTLRQLRNEVGKDAARFFYLMRRCEQHMDFDLQLAKSQSNENPVFYVQYAHARVCSVFRQLDDKDLTRDIEEGMNHLALLSEPQELALVTRLSRYPEIIENAALKHEPHLLIQYLRDLAKEFHTYYNAHKVLVEQSKLRNARLNLTCAVQQTITNGLTLLGISSPESM